MAWTVSGSILGPTGPAGSAGSQGPQGVKGDAGAGITIAGSVATYSALPSNLGASDAGKAYEVTADGKLYIWSGTAFPANGQGGQFVGPAGTNGAPGPANSLGIGTVSTGSAGTNAAATITGTSPSQTLNMTIPAGAAGSAGSAGVKGDTGATGSPGAASSLSIGTVTTGAVGASAAATIGGSPPSQTLNLTLPTGATGATGSSGSAGSTGAAGARGSKWFTGTTAPTTVSGSLPGDMYLDTVTGAVYELS